MRCFLEIVALSLLSLISGLATATAAEYSDPQGFSLTYPDDWAALPSGFDAVKGRIPPNIQKWVEKNKVDLSHAAVLIIRNGDEDFLENINVVVARTQAPTSGRAAKELSEVMREKCRSMGIAIEDLEVSVQQVGSNEAVVFDHKIKLPFLDSLLKQKQVIIPGGGKTYTVTCTAKDDTFAKYSSTFDGILASFRCPPPVAQGFDWGPLLTGATVGSAIGLLVALYRKIGGKR
jgi:gas vesicle protein